jgi:PPOX class probable F420-dependent enzyme
VEKAECEERFWSARVARLATVGTWPHLVPITFAALGEETIVSAVDDKPKRTLALRRLANIASEPRVAVLADWYEEDWDKLWWVRADGVAEIASADDGAKLHERATTALRRKYGQYADRAPLGPVIVIEVRRWSGWAASAALACAHRPV